jgi:hypothetical protein
MLKHALFLITINTVKQIFYIKKAKKDLAKFIEKLWTYDMSIINK